MHLLLLEEQDPFIVHSATWAESALRACVFQIPWELIVVHCIVRTIYNLHTKLQIPHLLL